jgi:hypothetical protein
MEAVTMTNGETAAVRADVFGHLAGLVMAPTVTELRDRGVFDLLGDPTECIELDQVVDRTRGNRGYLRVALRLLACCGWLKQHSHCNERSPSFALTPEGRVALRLAPRLYSEVVPFVPKAIFLEDLLFGKSDEPVLASLQSLVLRARERWGLAPQDDSVVASVHKQILRHLDGVLVGPAMVALARSGILNQLEIEPLQVDTLPGNRANLNCVFDLLDTQGWAVHSENEIALTARGLYAAKIATSYGVTVSYLPLCNVVSTLLFGNPRMPRVDESGVELLVNRDMNVWGSGGAHKTYFKALDEIIVEIFNRPIQSQPQGICDMGCGDGTLLEHLYHVVKTRTARGTALNERPLVIVGVDFNKVARRVAKQNLRKARIPAYYVIPGDINRPAQLAGDLEALGLDVHDLLHVRSFLDHNRTYSPPTNYVRGTRIGKSTGAFAYFGLEIAPDELEENLVRHLRRWAPYVGRFGLLDLELHTLPPELTAANIEKTPATAYDGTHGFSDQYLVELPIFLDCAREAGLQADQRYQFKFPPSELATVTVNFFTTSTDVRSWTQDARL